PESNDARIVLVDVARHETGFDRPVDEADRAVVTEDQRVGDVADRRTVGSVVAPDGEHQLVLGRADADLRRLRLPPVEKAADPGPERKQAPVVTVGKVGFDPGVGHVIYRSTICCDVRAMKTSPGGIASPTSRATRRRSSGHRLWSASRAERPAPR